MVFPGFNQTLSVSRPTGSHVDGYWVAGSPSTISIEASVQPADAKARKNVPEGFDVDSAYMLGTLTLLRAAERGGMPSDQVTLGSDVYEVVNVKPWQNDVINHYWVTVALPDNG